jgi:hypothetical protein
MSNNVLISVIPVFSEAIKAFFFENKTRQCIVYGHSMEPFLSFGESIEIMPYAGLLKKGHCYAFITGTTITIHRFIKNLNNEYALFAGDSSLLCDCVPLANVIGELSPCQNNCALSIIGITNNVFCTLMQGFNKSTLVRRLRRCIIRSMAKPAKMKGYEHEKKI